MEDSTNLTQQQQQNQNEAGKNEQVRQKLQVRTCQVDQDELVRLFQVEAMELPDLGLVVSGMSGRFPKSDSVNEFEENLRDGRDMINDQDNSRFTCGLWGLPPRAGRLNDLSRFDHEFFGFSSLEEANYVDFQLRILYEVVYESILDAGVNPTSLRGTNTGVFFGLHCNEFENAMGDDPAFKSSGYYAQFAVKVAQYFDLHGITVTFDAACASGFVGLHNAVEALRDGIVDQAIVCSSNIPIHPTGSFIFYQMQMLSPTGYSRFLDSRADGYVKSEACVSLLLQREQVAKRNYASFMATMTSVDGYKPEGITFPSDKSQESLIRAAKELACLSTNHVEYLEAHGTGTPAGDPQEARAISNVYFDEATDRDRRRIGPLLVGSVKTCMGHSEAASGLCALVKVALQLEHELMYRNLHYDQPNTNIEALMDGRLRFVDEPLKLSSKIIPMSCYGFGGANVHVICRANKRESIPQLGSSSNQHLVTTGGLPRLVLMFGRDQEQLASFFETILKGQAHNTRNCLTDDYLSLLDSLSSVKIDRLMNVRGFLLVDSRQRRAIVTSVKRCDLKPVALKSPLVDGDLGRRHHFQEAQERRCHLAYAGLGCQWQGMGAGLAKLKPFLETCERLAGLLEPYKSDGLDLMQLLMERHQEDTTTTKEGRHIQRPPDKQQSLCQSFVSIVAYQVAKTNIVRDVLEVKPLGAILGHSLGEISCAYASGLFNEREALMVAYQLGLALDELKPEIAGKMVAIVGLDSDEICKLVALHSDLYKSLRVSCVNGPNSVTISGRHEDVDEFLLIELEVYRSLIMVHEVHSEVALHNEVVMDRGLVRARLTKALERVLFPLTDYDRARTSWVSSFLHGQSEADESLAQQANVRYFVEMLCRQVDMNKTLAQLEADSLIYELSSSNLLESQVIQVMQRNRATPNVTTTNRRASAATKAQMLAQTKRQATTRKFHYVKSMQKHLDPDKQLVRFLSSLGEIYQAGATFKLANLYELQTGRHQVFPVRRQTPSISSLVSWDHSSSLFVPRYPMQFSKSSAKSEIPVDLLDRDKYLSGHCVDGRVLFPATGYLLLVWRIFSFTKRRIYDACFQNIERELMPVEFRNVRLHRAVILGGRQAQLYIHFEEGTGRFEVKEGGSVVVDGQALSPQENPSGLLYDEVRQRQAQEEQEMSLDKADIYKQFRVSGYDYGESFQCVESSSYDGRVCKVKFNGHFVSLTDSILQSIFLAISQYTPSGALFLPTRFDYVRFQPEIILRKLQEAKMPFDQSEGALNNKAKREMMNKIMERESDAAKGVDLEQDQMTDQDQERDKDQELEQDQEQEESKPECIFQTYCDPETGIIITDGIEMRGIKASPAPRRSDTNDVILESYQFVRDVEVPLEDEKLTQFEEVTQRYVRVCDSMSLELLMRLYGLNSSKQLNGLLESGLVGSGKILLPSHEVEAYKRQYLECLYEDQLNESKTQAAKDDGAATKTSYDIKKNGRRTLMSVLDQLLTLAPNSTTDQRLIRAQVAEKLKENKLNLLKDLTQTSHTSERFLRPLVECVLENVCMKKSKMRMVEINLGDGIMRQSFQQLIQQIEPKMALDYSLAHPDPNRLHGSQTTPASSTTTGSPGTGGQATTYKTHTLKPGNLEALFQDNSLKNLDFVLYKDSSCYRADSSTTQGLDEARRALTAICQALKPGGYCLVLARQKFTLSERVAFSLGREGELKELPEMIKEVEQMNARLEERCKSLVEAGATNQDLLLPIGQKSDLNGCLMMLLRRPNFCQAQEAPEGGATASKTTPATTNDQASTQTKPVEKLLLRVRHDHLDWLEQLKANFYQPGEGQSTEAQTNDCHQNKAEQDAVQQGTGVGTREPRQVWLCAVASKQQPISGLIGMMQSLRKELGSSHLRCFYDMATFAERDEPIGLDEIETSPNFREALRRDQLWNCVDAEGNFGSYRHFTINKFLAHENYACDKQQLDVMELMRRKQKQENDDPTTGKGPRGAYVNNSTRGDLSSFAWFETPFRHLDEPVRRNQLARVAYAALNFRDIMLATGRLSLDAMPLELAMSDCMLGLEFSGYDAQGKRVMGMVNGRGIATHVLCPPDSSIRVELPDHLSLREAATIPVVYATAIMALIYRGQMQRGETVLVHAGSGGVGQAALRLALHFGLEVYTTVGSDEKRQFLIDEFGPLGLKRENILNSRTCAFESQILEATEGRGVDLVLNSLADDKLQASLNCLRDGGRFLEIGKYDMAVDARLELLKLETNKTFHGILLDKLFEKDRSPAFKRQMRLVLDTLREGLVEGYIKPIRHQVFKRHQVEEAFRFMASGKHIGKVLIEIDPSEPEEGLKAGSVVHPLDLRVPIKAVPRFHLSPLKSFIVTGGLGGFGLELCKWLVGQGARQLVVTSRSGLRTGYQRATMRRLEQRLQVKCLIVKESEADASKPEGARRLLEIARELAPSSQVGGIFHLAMVLRDTLLEKMTREDFELVCRPKVEACLRLDEALQSGGEHECEYFVAFSSITSGKGNAGQANYAYANSCLERVCERRRARGQHGLAIQWGAIGDVGVAFENLGGNDVIIGGTLPQRMPSCLATLAKLLCSPFATCLSVLPVNRNQDGMSERGDLVGAIMHVLGIKDSSKVSDEATLGDLGLDSLMAVEIRQYIEREYDMTLNIQEIRALTILRIREISETEKPAPGSTATAGPDGKGAKLPAVERKQVASYGKQQQDAGHQRTNNKTQSTTTPSDAKASKRLKMRALEVHAEQAAQLDKNMVATFVPAMELPDDDFCLLNPRATTATSAQTETPIFFLPPIHGQFDRLEPICSSLHRPCVGLNWTRKLGQVVTADEAVEIYLRLLERTDWQAELRALHADNHDEHPDKSHKAPRSEKPRRPRVIPELSVDLVGYSFGATIAFELMVAIERRRNLHKNRIERRLSNGSERPPVESLAELSAVRNHLKPGRLILLDGSPKQIELGSQYLANLTRKQPLRLEDKVDELLMLYLVANVRKMESGRDPEAGLESRLPQQQQQRESKMKPADYLALQRELKLRKEPKDKVLLVSERLAELARRSDAPSGPSQSGTVKPNPQPSSKAIAHAIEAYLRRYELINNYKARVKLTGDCTLIRAEKLYLKSRNAGQTGQQNGTSGGNSVTSATNQNSDQKANSKFNEDLDLTLVVEGRVDLYIMSGDHDSFLSENSSEIGQLIEQITSADKQSSPNRLGRPVGEETNSVTYASPTQMADGHVVELVAAPEAELGA